MRLGLWLLEMMVQQLSMVEVLGPRSVQHLRTELGLIDVITLPQSLLIVGSGTSSVFITFSVVLTIV